MLVLLLLIASGVAVSQQTFTDTFEDGNVDGWEHPPTGIEPNVSTDSFEGNYSLLATTEQLQNTQENPAYQWVSGPTLAMDEGFTATGTVRPVWVSGTGITNRIGLAGDNQSASGENAYLIFDQDDDATYLATSASNDPTDADTSDGTVGRSFDGVWAHYELHSPADEQVLYAKVWEAGTVEPATYQLNVSGFNATAGQFAVNPGGNMAVEREIYLDSVTIEGTTVPDDAELELDTRDYIKPNESAPYSVHFNDSGSWSEVTDSPNTTVTSSNTSVIVANATENLLEAQPGVNTTVNVTAEYMASDGTVYQTTKTITVAQATVDNLEILPAIWRFGATIGDDTIFFLIIAMLTGIVGTRLSTAFGGISLYWVVVMIGWFSGWLSLGILLVTTAMAVFIGLNLALTIDYGMRPGQG